MNLMKISWYVNRTDLIPLMFALVAQNLISEVDNRIDFRGEPILTTKSSSI